MARSYKLVLSIALPLLFSGVSAAQGIIGFGGAGSVGSSGAITPAFVLGIVCDSRDNATKLNALANVTVQLPDNSVCLFSNISWTSANNNVKLVIGANTYLRQINPTNTTAIKMNGVTNSGIYGSALGPSYIDINANNYGSFGSNNISALGVSVNQVPVGYPASRYIALSFAGGGCSTAPIGYMQLDANGTQGFTSSGTGTTYTIVQPGQGCDGVTQFTVAPYQGTFTTYPAVPTNQSPGYTITAPTFTLSGAQTIYNAASASGATALYAGYITGCTGIVFSNVRLTSTGSLQSNLSAYMSGLYIFNSDILFDGFYANDNTLNGLEGIYLDPYGSSTNNQIIRNSDVEYFGNNIHVSNSGASTNVKVNMYNTNFSNAYDPMHGVGPYGNGISLYKVSNVNAYNNLLINDMLSCWRNAGAGGNGGSPDLVSIATQYNTFNNNVCSGSQETAVFLGDLGGQLSTANGNIFSNFINGIDDANLTDRPTYGANYASENTFTNGTGFALQPSRLEGRRNHITDVTFGVVFGTGGTLAYSHLDDNDCHDSAFNATYSMGACFLIDRLLTNTVTNVNNFIGAGNTMDSTINMKGTTTAGSPTITNLSNISGSNFAVALPNTVLGLQILGGGIPVGTTISAIPSATSLTMSANATTANTNEYLTLGSLAPLQFVTDTGVFTSNPAVAVVGVTGTNGAAPVVYVTGAPPTAGNIIVLANVQGTWQINGAPCIVGTVTPAVNPGTAGFVPPNFPCTNLIWQSWGTYTVPLVPDVFPSWVLQCGGTASTLTTCQGAYNVPIQVGLSSVSNISAQPSISVRKVLATQTVQTSFSADALNHESFCNTGSQPQCTGSTTMAGSSTLNPGFVSAGVGIHIHQEGIYTTSANDAMYLDILLGNQSLIGTAAGSVINPTVGTIAGAGCTVGDTLNVTGGTTTAVVTVAAVNSGVPASYTVSYGGNGYATVNSSIPAVTTSGTAATCTTCFAAADVGKQITGLGINANTWISAYISSSSVTLSQAVGTNEASITVQVGTDNNTTAKSSSCSTLPSINYGVGGVTVTFGAAATSGHWTLDFYYKCRNIVGGTGCSGTGNGMFTYDTGNNTTVTAVNLDNGGNNITTVIPGQANLIAVPIHFINTSFTYKVDDGYIEVY